MKGFHEKLKYIIVPYLLSFFAVMGGYTILRWVLDNWLGILKIKEIVLNLFLPVGIMCLVITFYIIPRLKILHIERRDLTLYFIIFVYATVIPLCISQNYISSSFYKTIEINKIEDLIKYPTEKYFFIKELPVANVVGAYNVDTRPGQNYISVHEFFAFPINEALGIWYGDRYTFSIRNNLSEQEKNEEYNKIISGARNRIGIYELRKSGHFELLKSSMWREGLAKGIRKSNSTDTKQPLFILTPLTESFRASQDALITWFFSMFFVGLVSLLFFIRKPEVSFIGLKQFKEGTVKRSPSTQFILDSVKINGKYPLTAILINVNIFAFIISMLFGVLPVWPSVQELVRVGALNGNLISQGEYWRLLSSTFLHAGVGHLLANMFALSYFGSVLEQVLSKALFFSLFIVSGLVGAVFAVIWMPESTVVGASGAIFGFVGATFLLTKNRKLSLKKRKEAFIVGIIVVVVSTLAGVMIGDISHAAHFGGLATGLILFYLSGHKTV